MVTDHILGTIMDEMEYQPSMPMIIMGDLNADPQNIPMVMELIEEGGWTDCSITLTPSALGLVDKVGRAARWRTRAAKQASLPKALADALRSERVPEERARLARMLFAVCSGLQTREAQARVRQALAALDVLCFFEHAAIRGVLALRPARRQAARGTRTKRCRHV